MNRKLKFYAYKNVIKFTHSLRSRKDIINLILSLITKEFWSNNKGSRDISTVFYIDKMSRVFIYESIDKIHSFGIPFFIKAAQDSFFVFNKSNELLDSKLISFLKAIFIKIDIDKPNFYKDIESIFEILKEYDIQENEFYLYLTPIFELLTFETGYLRYDHDIQRENVNHPEYHIDFNYSQNTTFKLGLHKKLSCQEFINLVDIKNNGIFFIE